MRVAIGLHSMLLGGSQINTIDLAAELRRRGHDVVVFAIDATPRSSSIQPVADAAGIEIQQLDPSGNLRAQAKAIGALVDNHRSEVLHVYHEHGHLGPVGAMVVSRRPAIGLVVTNWMMENTRWLPPHASLVVGFRDLRREASTYHRGPIHVIEPPVDLERDRPDPAAGAEFRRRHGLGDADVVGVIASRLDREMKLDSVVNSIRAVSLLGDVRLRLVIVGDGDAVGDIRDLAAEVNESLGRPAVLLVGQMHDPRPAYAAADFVLGMGGSALRALAFGTPLVVLGLGAFSSPFRPETLDYFLDHGFFGQLDADPDGVELASYIDELSSDDLRVERGLFGRAVVEERFGLDPLTTRLEQVYEEATANPTARWKRWVDVGYVTAYDIVHRRFPPSVRARLRSKLPL